MIQRKSRKRPCRICRKWFSPDPRVGDRQKTCGAKNCQVKWHAKKCSEWNNQHPTYFREIYLNKKLTELNEAEVKYVDSSVKSSQLPRKLIQEVISAQHLVIIEYVNRLLFKSFKEVIMHQLTEIKEKPGELLREEVSRGDSRQRAP